MPCIECTQIKSTDSFDVFSGKIAGVKFHALIAPEPSPCNFRGGRLQGAAIADREDGGSNFYGEPWFEADQAIVMLEALHDLAETWSFESRRGGSKGLLS